MQMKTSKTNMIGTIITAVILIAVVVLSNIGTTQMSVAGNAISKVFMPIQNGVVYLKNKITKNDQAISDIDSLKEETMLTASDRGTVDEIIFALETLGGEKNDFLCQRDRFF